MSEGNRKEETLFYGALDLPPEEWDIALLLPTQRFSGDTKLVWSESRHAAIR